MKFFMEVNDEDVAAIENLQKGLANRDGRGMHGEFIPKYDWTVHRFQNMVLSGLEGHTLNEDYMPRLESAFEQMVRSA